MPKPNAAQAPKRVDPPSRGSGTTWDELKNRDPGKHYTFVDPNSEMYGISYYESIGYEIERRVEGGVKPSIGRSRADGDLITVMDQVLMSCPIELKNSIDEDGVGGSGGWNFVKKMEDAIVKPGGVDGLRGIGSYVSVINETGKPTIER